jgi:hypothetical protein
MHFTGFESKLHGISSYDWAVGTTPGDEDIQPYVERGIYHFDELDHFENGKCCVSFVFT